MNQHPDDDDLPVNFLHEEDKLVVPKREADLSSEDDEDFSTLEAGDTPFTSIEDAEDFQGREGDLDRHHTPPAQMKQAHVNEYGVKVRAGKRNQPLADDDEIQFSVNLGDN